MCVGFLIDVARQHMEARPIEIPGLKVAHAHETGRRRFIIRDIHATARNATVGSWLSCPRSTRIGWVFDAEVL